MGSIAGWWTGTAVAGSPEAVAKSLPLRNGEFTVTGRNVVREPVRERPLRRIGVVQDQRETPCSLRRTRQHQWRRRIGAITRELPRYGIAVMKRRAGNAEGHGVRSIRWLRLRFCHDSLSAEYFKRGGTSLVGHEPSGLPLDAGGSVWRVRARGACSRTNSCPRG